MCVGWVVLENEVLIIIMRGEYIYFSEKALIGSKT